MIYLVALVVLVLATARLTRLIYFDDITLSMRLWIDDHLGTGSFLSRMVWCPWCASVWASLLVCSIAGTGVAIWTTWPLGAVITVWILAVPALAYPAGWLVEYETTRTSEGK